MKGGGNSKLKYWVSIFGVVIAAIWFMLNTMWPPENTSEVPVSAEAILEEAQSAQWADAPQVQLYTFRNDHLLNQHYEKHGIEMGFATIEEYVAAANAVIYHPDVLHKQEAEDNDDVYFLEATNEFVVVSTDGYIRTYFIASGGIDYYNRQ